MLPTKHQTRRIPLSRRSHIIGFQPLPTGTAAHESALERDLVTLTAFNDRHAIIQSQPVTIHFEEHGLRRRYTPDFLIDSRGARALIEVKYEEDLRERWSTLRGAFDAARQWAQGQRMTFRIATEHDIRGPMLENAKRLLPLRGLPIDRRMAIFALTRTHDLRGPNFRALLAALPDRALALATLWRLIARRELCVDLAQPITMDSRVWPT